MFLQRKRYGSFIQSVFSCFFCRSYNNSPQKIKFWPREVDLIEAEFNVIEYFKKGNNEINIVRDLSWGAGNCSIGLMSGLEFVFFIAKEQGKIKNYVNMCSGTYPIHLKKSDFQNRFDRLRSFGKK